MAAEGRTSGKNNSKREICTHPLVKVHPPQARNFQQQIEEISNHFLFFRNEIAIFQENF